MRVILCGILRVIVRKLDFYNMFFKNKFFLVVEFLYLCFLSDSLFESLGVQKWNCFV